MGISVSDLDLKIVPFGRRLSHMMVYSDNSGAEKGKTEPLYLGYTYGTQSGKTRYDFLSIEPVFNGRVLPFTYRANPGILEITTKHGKIDLCFDGTDLLRIRASGGVGLRFFLKFEGHEQFLDRLDGTLCAAYSNIGEFLFEVTAGRQIHDGKWITLMMKPADTTIDWLPDDRGELEGYIRYENSSVERPPALRDFDLCVRENLEDFQNWCGMYAKLPDRYEDVRLFAIYVIWVCHLKPQGLITTDMIYMMRTGPLMRAMGWHQSYQAMACYKNLDLAISLLHSMFTLQDTYGQLPDGTSDRYVTMTAPKPPFQGFALCYILDRVGPDALTQEQCALLYAPMCKWVNWWFTFRDRDGDGIPCYMHADESGWDDASIFVKGLPVETPDLSAFLVLCMEACGKLAARLGKAEESESWLKKSERLLRDMLSVFWNGNKFVCLLDGSHEVIDEESIAVYQPIILGKRLPKDVIDQIADTVGDPEKFLTPNGFASESQQSALYDVTSGAFMLGRILAPVQLMMTVGLYQAGRKDVALKNALRWCDQMQDVGPETVVESPPPKAPPMVTGAKPVYPTGRRLPGSYCSWGAAVYLILGTLLEEEETERSDE